MATTADAFLIPRGTANFASAGKYCRRISDASAESRIDSHRLAWKGNARRMRLSLFY